MKIQNTGTVQTIHHNPKFYGVYRVVCDKSKTSIHHRNTSWMFRPSLEECKKFYTYLSRVFHDVDKVNVYNYGCSLGYEAYSFIIGMLSGKKKNPEKFMPIIAKDYDEVIIKNAQEHAIILENSELSDIDKIFNYNGKKRKNFIDYVNLRTKKDILNYYNEIDADGDTLGIPSSKITNNVEFSVADIRTDYKNIKPQNSVIIATNFWTYMDMYDRFELARNLYNHLDKNCYIKIDYFDNGKYLFERSTDVSGLLMKTGFQPTPIENLYKK